MPITYNNQTKPRQITRHPFLLQPNLQRNITRRTTTPAVADTINPGRGTVVDTHHHQGVTVQVLPVITMTMAVPHMEVTMADGAPHHTVKGVDAIIAVAVGEAVTPVVVADAILEVVVADVTEQNSQRL